MKTVEEYVDLAEDALRHVEGDSETDMALIALAQVYATLATVAPVAHSVTEKATAACDGPTGQEEGASE